MKYLKLYKELLRQSLIRTMIYRVNFITVLFTNSAYFLIQLVFMNIIFSEINVLAGWTKYEVFFYIGTYAVIDALWVFGPFFNLLGIPELIRSGGLDAYLLKPINTQFLISLRVMDIGSLVSLLSGVMMVVYAIIQGGIRVTLLKFVLYIMTLFLAVMVEYSLYLMVTCLAFRFIKNDFAEVIHSIICHFANKPTDIYSGILKAMLMTIFPYGFLMTVATKTAISKITIVEYIYALGITFTLFILAMKCWKHAIKRYESVSS